MLWSASAPAGAQDAESATDAPQDDATAPPGDDSHEADESEQESLSRPPDAGPGGSEAEPALRPPELLDFVRAKYPSAALDERREGRVVLKLSINADGRVTEADVAEAAGYGFDEAAQAAALNFRFSPAKRDGIPVASRILYAYEFKLPDPPPTGSIRGRILMPGSGDQPAAGVEVTLTDKNAQDLAARTNAEGHFTIEELPPGRYSLRARAESLGEAETSLTVAEGQVSAPTLRLLPTGREKPIEVTVRGESEAERLRQSAQAVHVIETEQAQLETADLGEVLARSQGIGVRRGGGLGSGTRFSLNGLTDDQIRFFIDGVPLELSGYPFGIANVPVNLVERIEVYRGVVPIRFGADALGGAVNLVTDEIQGTRGGASYQAGSFGTHRATAGAHYLHEPTGFFARFAGFFDRSDNDYPIDVEVPDEQGKLSPARVYRFHDAYQAMGGNVEIGAVNRPFADRLLLRAFITDYQNELQNNVVMTRPYGEVEFGELSAGGSLRYENLFRNRFSVQAVAGYAYTATEFLDVGNCFYDWFGRCVRELLQPGEINSARDDILWEHGAFGRLNLGWQIHPQHALRVSVSPTFVTRTGNNRRITDPNARDILETKRDLLTVVTGVEYQLNLFDDRLENIFFVKHYFQNVRAAEPPPGVTESRSTNAPGVGNALRYRFVDWLYAKASYEWATRLPRVDEIFGDGILILDNPELEPEVSHNVNLGLTVAANDTPGGAFRVDINGFLRDAAQLIVLLAVDEQTQRYSNVFSARSLGIEGAVGWTSPGEYVALDGNVTYLDFRNTSSDGNFAGFEGDRIPNRPYLFANGSARFRFPNVFAARDEFALVWNTRYVHGFFRSWESAGITDFKDTVDAQLLHSVALTYLVLGQKAGLSFTAEVLNLTDQRAFDFFGVQRPGRAFYFKTTASF